MRNADGDKFSVVYMSFPDRWAAIAWICANQLHKHNMTELQRLKLLQEEYEARKKTQGTNNQYVQAEKSESGEILHFQSSDSGGNKTRTLIAKEHKIPLGAVKAAVQVGRGIDRAAEVDPEGPFSSSRLFTGVTPPLQGLHNMPRVGVPG